jgi:hypothetical protein
MALPTVFFLAFGRAGRNQRLTGKVVDDLRVNVIQRTVHVQPGTPRRSRHPLADALVHMAALLVLADSSKHETRPWSSAVGGWMSVVAQPSGKLHISR